MSSNELFNTPIGEMSPAKINPPDLPSYWTLSPSSFETTNSPIKIHQELKSAFLACSVDFKDSEEYPSGYYCKVEFNTNGINFNVVFDVVVFSNKPNYIVEIVQMNGERILFYEVLTKLAQALNITYINGRAFYMPPPNLIYYDLPELDSD